MSEYKIIHKETLIGRFYIEANSPGEAMQKYHDMVDRGKIDFSDLEPIDGEDYIEEGSFTAFLYGDDGITAEDISTYDSVEDAVSFAITRGWDEVVNDTTGEVVYRRR